MSVLSRIFGKSPPATDAPTAAATDTPAESPPPPDHAARAREDEASLSQALAAADMAAVGTWVLEGSSTRVRQRAAQAITDLDQLHELIRATRHGNDKSVYRILTTKRDALLAEARRLAQQQADVAAAAATIARHAGAPCDATYAAALTQLEARWQQLAAHATEDLRQEVARQLDAAREVIERDRQAQAADAERRRAEALAAEEATRQRELDAQAAAAAAAARTEALEAERRAERAKRAADEAAVRDMIGLLRQTHAALDHGGTARAARLRATIAEKLPHVPALPAWYERDLQQVDARIEELKDWKIFRVAPKRAELLRQMQSLVGADTSPEELAKHIRRLRDEWRTLNRGAGDDTTPEWQQFQEAAEKAYEPCREHFARQAAVRHENERQRELVLERLAAFAAAQSGEQPDWRAIRQVIFEARQEWRQHAPVDQAVVKSLQARFHELIDGLHKALDAEYARNVQAKRELVARTAELAKLEDTRQAIEETKNLQRTWKTVGIVPRREDNALWEEFRRHCDAVFDRSSQESAAQAAALEANVARAVAVCEEFERTAELTGEALLSAPPRLNALNEEFESLELPRASARELRQRFERAGDRCFEALRRQRAAAARQGWTDLFVTAAQVRAYALALAQGQSPADCEALRASAVAATADLAHAPKGGAALLEQRLAQIAAGDDNTDLAANEAALRLLCIRAELAADRPTPPEDLQLRREYQMQRLVESMGRGERSTPAGLDDLALEWITVGPVETAVHDALLARFERCRTDDRNR